ncbi:IS30 family transposase [Agromyces sp. MMS24-K17]|uniref:IS30 family transposase n=1 Tax=Agromyces sp. MMS24-K17 TaxID=3372850 RepID=UPI003755400A
MALGLVLDGLSAREVGKRLGVGQRAVHWWAMLAGVELSPGRHGGARYRAPVPMPGAGSGHGRRLSPLDRARIQVGLEQGMSQRKVAAMIGVHASTVSRELARASLTYRNTRLYDARVADHRAAQQRSRPKTRKLDQDPRLRHAVIEGLSQRFSPQQIAGRLPVLFPGREDMRVSHETIYQALYVQGRGALRHELTVEKALRSGRADRKPQSKLPARTGRPWLDGARLTDRPAEVADRAVPGHWEGDLVVGPDNSGIVTLVERQTRFVLLGRLPGTRESQTVTDVLAGMIEHLPAVLRKTITWDQGTEMARHATFTVATGCKVFFCDPHSPWQRGSNENTNGLIRDFYPKGTNFNSITDDELAQTQRLLNIRPRQTLHFHTPAERLDELITGAALTG